MVQPQPRISPSGPLLLALQEFWEDVNFGSGFPNADLALAPTPRVQGIVAGAGKTGTLSINIPKPVAPEGYKVEVADIIIGWGGASADVTATPPSLVMFGFASSVTDPTPNANQFFGYTLPAATGPFNVGRDTSAVKDMTVNASFATLPAQVEDPNAFTLRIDIISGTYVAPIYLNTVRVKWRISKS